MTPAIGLIGPSGYGQVHLEQILNLHRAGRARFTAVTVPCQSEMQSLPAEIRQSGISLYSDYNDMLNAHKGRLDLCCIPTPIHWHGVMTVDSLRAGAHVLVEKPLAGSLEECRMIRAAQEETGGIVAVGFQNVYDPSSHRIKERLLSGAIGRIRRMSAYGLSPRPSSYYRRNNWAGKLHLDGRPVLDSPVNNAMAHYLQWLLFIGGSSLAESLIPTSIEAEFYRANPIESPDTVNLRIETNRGIDVRCAVSHASKEKIEMKIVVEGDQGSLTWEQNGKAEFCCTNGTVEAIPIPTHKEMQMRIVERVVDYITTGKGFICTPEHAELHIRCIVAAHSAAAVSAIPDRYISETHLDGSVLRHIEGIQEAVRDAAVNNLSFNALEIPWAVAAPQRTRVPGGS